MPSSNLGAHLYFDASCAGGSGYKCKQGQGDSNNYAAVVYVYAADLTLEQSAAPTATNVSGELASAPTVAGTSDVAFSASDPVSGVYETVFSVDGQVVQRAVVDDNGGKCKDVGQTSDGSAAFLYLRPCAPSVSPDVGFDATRVGNGAHHLVVRVIDAAGNAATVLDRSITIANPTPPGTPNGTNASTNATLTASWKGAGRGRLTQPYGRSEVIAGRLTAPGGAPIASAEIDVSVTPSYTGARKAQMTGVRTGPDGRFTIRLHRGLSSRTLRLSYRTHVGDATPVASRTLTLSVLAGVTLHVTPRTAGVGATIHFTGRLRSGPLPAGGKLLVLEARSPGGRWLEFDVVHSGAHGHYHASYRFKFPGPADYQFRVVSQAEADYPFATGSSNVVGVHEY